MFSFEGAGQQACYDKSGKLLDFHEGGGTFDKAHPAGYTDIDWNVFPPDIKVLKVYLTCILTICYPDEMYMGKIWGLHSSRYCFGLSGGTKRLQV